MYWVKPKSKLRSIDMFRATCEGLKQDIKACSQSATFTVSSQYEILCNILGRVDILFTFGRFD